MRSPQRAWFFLVFCIFFYSNSVQGKCLKDQRDLLLDLSQNLVFYDDFDPTQFASKLNSWSSSTDCCSSWDGIKCDVAGHVVSLDLSSELLLSFANNTFSTPIPSGIGRLSNMKYLNLSNSGFYEQIPMGISQMTKLVTLDLSGNSYLTLKDPDLETLVRNLTGVTELVLDGVIISEHGSKWLLSLSSCELTGPLDSSLSKLQSLRKLHLDHNNISAEVPEFFGEFRNLTSLHLSSCGLYGNFPNKVIQLQTLQSLDLSSNRGLEGSLPEFPKDGLLRELQLFFTSFTGELPDSIGNLRLLSTLDLHNCEFNGSIPASMSKLNQLRYLDLSLNSFTGYLGENFIGSSSPLEFLDLSYNHLQGHLPQVIFEFSRLYHLGLVSNRFSGTISLDMLFSKIYLSDNRFSIAGTSADFALYPQLRWLSLSSCNLSEIPIFLRNQSKLQVLELSHNQIRGKIPDWIWKIGNGDGYGKLNTLNLSYNFLQDPEKPFPDNRNNLILPSFAIILDYSLNNFTTISNISSSLSQVAYFSLAGNQISGEFPIWICDAHSLVNLDLSNNNFKGPTPPCLGSDFYNLRILNLGGNGFQGTIPEFPADSCGQEVLDLNGNNFDGELPKSLDNCTNLKVLEVGNNQLHGRIPSWLGSMSNLQVLVLRSNKFYGSWGGNQGTECNFPLLQIIDLSSNNFSGSLPKECFSSWKAMMVNQVETNIHGVGLLGLPESEDHDLILGLADDAFRYYYQQKVKITSKGQDMELQKVRRIFTSIDFSNNKFDGEIPEIIGIFTLLYTLDFSRNRFTSRIPPAFGNLTNLESLDLSQNKLTGEIPFELARLSFLSFMNLSFNKLEGKIPSGGQFATFDPSFFEGNVGLCGYPLSKDCNSTNVESPSNSKNKIIYAGGFDWVLFVVTFSGFVVGASMVIGPQYFWKKGRDWANERINRILNIT
ncbi:hypothetical protein MKW94_004551 [Papaver nudicaule]|uniref:Leucine-rich repeat-containing N-terminal plant-type domain-containing protein n=1 Tax=Papaver nudicaule TaxID=74823 RepID=A0AA41S851_PAPNU|nr:hypothetical protein [Papaver nudicaule]